MKNEKKKKSASDFTATLGRERKEKFGRIADANNRSMNGQLCQWIDEAHDPEMIGSEK